MKIWVLHVGEPLPIDDANERQLRMSLLAHYLASTGHDVVWWTSTFDHTHKRQRFAANTDILVADRLLLRLLHARPYARNISAARLINHRQAALEFERLAHAIPVADRPDVIFATLPTVEMAAAASRFGVAHRIPVVIDLRDLHPDIYLSLVPALARPLARIALAPLYRHLREAVRGATALVAIAPSFLDWGLRHAGRLKTSYDEVFPLGYPEITATTADIEAAARRLGSVGVDDGKQIVWYVGTFNRWIDLAPVIKAARSLNQEGDRDVQFVVSGSGDFGDRWRDLARDLPNVVFTGWVDVPGIIHMKRIAWAGLAPYRDGFLTVGNKLFEYMAGGLPILLSIRGDALSIVEGSDAGLGYDNDAERLVTAIRYLQDGGNRDRMAANSLSAFRSRYSAATVYPRMADFILRIARDHAAG